MKTGAREQEYSNRRQKISNGIPSHLITKNFEGGSLLTHFWKNLNGETFSLIFENFQRKDPSDSFFNSFQMESWTLKQASENRSTKQEHEYRCLKTAAWKQEHDNRRKNFQKGYHSNSFLKIFQMAEPFYLFLKIIRRGGYPSYSFVKNFKEREDPTPSFSRNF